MDPLSVRRSSRATYDRRPGRAGIGPQRMNESILQRVAGGDQAAMRECIDRFGGLVWSLARRLAPADAEDAAQEIFVDLWRSAGRFDPAVAGETTFVAMIARRRLVDRRRRAERRPEARSLDESPSMGTGPALADDLEIGEDAAVARRALQSLAPDQQRVLRLAVDQGLSHDQIAQATGLPLGTVKTHIRRGLIRIREMLAGEPVGRAAP